MKGVTYSLDALLGGKGPTPQTSSPIVNSSSTSPTKPKSPAEQHAPSTVDEEDFANVNGIEYSLDDLIGDETSSGKQAGGEDVHLDQRSDKNGKAEDHDASRDSKRGSLLDHAAAMMEVGPMPWTVKGVPRPGNKMFFAVVYLAPGDYHRCLYLTSFI